MATLDEIYKPIQAEMREVNQVIASSLMTDTVREMKEINSLLLRSPGKRLRPAMVILCAHASLANGRRINGEQKRIITNTAAAFELIHMATLVHDDVMDASMVRHKKPTINAAYDDNMAICTGDFLFSRAFHLLSMTKNPTLLEIASLAVKEVCEGQILQVWRRHDLGMGMKDYDAIINKKTASLFMAACTAGTIASGRKCLLPSFGFHFGRGFQMIDDYLDIISDEKTLGKRPGENLRAGELTIPILLLLQSTPKSSRSSLAKRCMKDMGLLKRMLAEKSIGRQVKGLVGKEMRRAEQALDALHQSPHSAALHGLLDHSVSHLKP